MVSKRTKATPGCAARVKSSLFAPERTVEPPAGFWWNDPDKLLGAVFKHAGEDAKFAIRLAEAIGKWAKNKPKEKTALQFVLKGARRGAPATPHWAHVHVLASYNVLRNHHGLKHEEALDWLENNLLGKDMKLSRRQVERRLSVARRLVDPAHVMFRRD
jgi:hypothetical protein